MTERRGRLSPEEMGLEVVDVVREPDEPRVCPQCGGALRELLIEDDLMPLGDGHTYTDVHNRRGLCAVCGWVDV